MGVFLLDMGILSFYDAVIVVQIPQSLYKSIIRQKALLNGGFVAFVFAFTS